MTTVEQARDNLSALLAEKTALTAEFAELSKRLAAVESRLRQLDGAWRTAGEIRDARNKLDEAERLAADAGKVVVQWAVAPTRWGKQHNPYVVEKVTAKRITIREAGESQVDHFRHDGASGKSYIDWRIDIAKTFPNGLPIKVRKEAVQ